MANKTQRRGLPIDIPGIIGEIDNIHRVLNELEYPEEVKIVENYTLTVFDRRISCMRPSLTVRFAQLREEDDGLILFVKDKSGLAASGNIVILPQVGATIEGSSSTSITANFGKFYFQWDASEKEYFLV